MSDSLQSHGLYSPWNSPGQNTGVGSHSLLQGIFPTQGLNPGLLHCRQILYWLSHKGSPSTMQVVMKTVCAQSLSRVQLLATLWMVVHQAPLSMGFSRHGVGCHFLLQGILPIQRLNLCLLHLQADSLPLSHKGSPNNSLVTFMFICCIINI